MPETMPIPATADLLKPWTDAYTALLDPWVKALQSAATAPNPLAAFNPSTRNSKAANHATGCGCGACAPDPCHCRCCVSDADLIVNARAGERRVIPLVIENNQRRERTVTLELSGWATHGGRKENAPSTVSLFPTNLTLRACEETTVTLTIETNMPSDQNNPNSTENGDANRERMGDVDDCVVYYADLRVTGCDIRPIRIAVAVSPRDCGAFLVDCRCGCC